MNRPVLKLGSGSSISFTSKTQIALALLGLMPFLLIICLLFTGS